jgi:hypothetical protein
MTSADFDVVLYKLLRYAYSCLQAGASPTVAKARELAGVNEAYLTAVFEDAKAHGYIDGPYVGHYADRPQPQLTETPWRITSDGARFVDENTRMAKARDFLGGPFASALATAVSATLQAF